jgi:hypothetical protein
MLADIAALIIAFISVRMSPKSWHKNTYGWARAEVLGKSRPKSLYTKLEAVVRFKGQLICLGNVG